MNVDSLYVKIAEKEATADWQGLSAAEKTFALVMLLWYELGNGGFRQFYFNTPGDKALDTIDALEAIGALETAGVMQKANSEFGPEGPSPVRARRQAQLSRLGEGALRRLSELDELIYDGPEDLELLLLGFAEAKHLDS
jgi:hypothetical protein